MCRYQCKKPGIRKNQVNIIVPVESVTVKCQQRALKKWKSMKFKEFRMILLKKFSKLQKYTVK